MKSLQQAADATLKLEQAAQMRVHTLASLTELMHVRGYSDDEIKDYMHDNKDVVKNLAESLEVLYVYIENGTVRLKLVERKHHFADQSATPGQMTVVDPSRDELLERVVQSTPHRSRSKVHRPSAKKRSKGRKKKYQA